MTGSWDSASGQPHASAESPQRPPPYPVAPGPPAGRSRNGLGIASLLIGLIALLASSTVGGGVLLGVLAATLGLVARAQVRRGRASNGDVAMTGVVLGMLAIVASMIFALFWVVPSMRMTSSQATAASTISTMASSAAI